VSGTTIERAGVRESNKDAYTDFNIPLILSFGVLRRSTDYILVVVTFSRREKE